MERSNKKILNKLKQKYRLIIINDNTYKEVWWMRLSRINVIGTIIFFQIAFTSVIILTIAYSPLKEFIPGYPDGEVNKNIVLNSIKTDSLENALNIKEQYFNNLRAIIMGRDVNNYVNNSLTDTIKDSTISVINLEHKISKDDSLLRLQIEKHDNYNLSEYMLYNSAHNELSELHLIAPLKGVITNRFNSSKKHYGIDVVAAKNELIISALKGKVVFSGWSVNTGNIIHIQHENNLITIYKHLGKITINQGDKIDKGEPIAIVGNTGEETTGPHLHFELWHKGEAINPEEYIIF